jgi:hypothetical protein
MSKGNGKFTPFFTDKLDSDLKLDKSVFFNFGDQSAVKNMRGIPNIYGPISFVFSARKILEFSDFELHRLSLTETEKKEKRTGIFDPEPIADEVGLESMFQVDKPYFFEKRSEHAELIIHEELIDFGELVVIVVDPVPVESGMLIDRVRSLFPQFQVREREFGSPTSRTEYINLCKHVISHKGAIEVDSLTPSLRDYYSKAIENREKPEEGIRIWADRIWNSNHRISISRAA